MGLPALVVEYEAKRTNAVEVLESARQAYLRARDNSDVTAQDLVVIKRAFESAMDHLDKVTESLVWLKGHFLPPELRAKELGVKEQVNGAEG